MDLTRFDTTSQRELVEGALLQAETQLYGTSLDLQVWERMKKLSTPSDVVIELDKQIKQAKTNIRGARCRISIYTEELAKLPVPEKEGEE